MHRCRCRCSSRNSSNMCILGFGWKVLITFTVEKGILGYPWRDGRLSCKKPLGNTTSEGTSLPSMQLLASSWMKTMSFPPSVVCYEVYFIEVIINSLFSLLTWLNGTMIIYANRLTCGTLCTYPLLHLFPLIRTSCLVHIKEYINPVRSLETWNCGLLAFFIFHFDKSLKDWEESGRGNTDFHFCSWTGHLCVRNDLCIYYNRA